MSANQKLLITGAGGFIGSHLAEEAVKAGYSVKAFIRYNSRNDWGWLETSQYKDEMEIICGDIRDFDSVKDAIKDCSNIFHLAALIGIPYSYVSPLAYIKTNIEGTYNVLEAAKNSEVENLLITSTSETYGTAQYIPIDEKHPIVGQSPYSASKIAADQLAISYFRSFELPIKIVRPFNTFGPRQSARAIIPAIISQIHSGNNSITLGNIHPTRDFTYVLDTVKGYFEIAKSGDLFGEITNIGMNSEISINNLAFLISELMNMKIEINSSENRIRPEKSEVERLFCDNSKLIKYTNWKPDYDLKKGLIETIQWFENHKDRYKSELYNI